MSRTLWLADAPLVLASKSAARRKLLENAGLQIETRPAGIDERAIELQRQPKDAVEAAVMLASEKAKAISATMPGHLVLGADQTLALGEQRFSKPKNRDDAAEQLRALSGRAHELHSAIAMVRAGRIVFFTLRGARMTMRKLSEAAIAAYLETAGEAATASVGAYQVEGPGIQLFEKIEGDYFTILGLPLLPLLAFLRSEKYIAP